jgi:ribonuclease P protein component
VSRGSVVVYVAVHEDDSDPRVGLIVNKAVGNSVVRHRVSRQIRAAIAPLLPTLDRGTCVVVRALPGSAADPDLAEQVAGGLSAGMGREGGRT